MNKYIKIISCCIFLSALESQADFTSAKNDYEAKKFPEAMQEFKRTAELGHKQSQLNIGVMHFRGEGVDKNVVDAYAWILLSAEDNNSESLRIRDIVSAKLNEQQKIKADIKLKELTEIYGNQVLRENLFPVFSEKKPDLLYASFKGFPNIPINVMFSEKISEFEIECDVDTKGNLHNYSLLKSEGVKAPKELMEHFSRAKIRPKKLNGQPMWQFNSVYSVKVAGKGRGNHLMEELNNDIRENFTPEFDWSNSENIYQHARALDYSKQSKKIKQQKTLLMLSAAQMGHAKAQTDIALNTLHGVGFEQDRKKGLIWLLAAAESKDNTSLYLAASLLYEGEIVDANKNKAIELLQIAANQQHTKSKMKLAWILATDKDEAFYEPQKALQLAKEAPADYEDQVTATETLAAAQAAKGLFDDAIVSQKLAVDFAKNIDNRFEEAKTRLNIYKQHQAWRQ